MGRKKRAEVIEELEIEAIGFEGISIARKDGMVRFVKGGVPGDILKTQQIKKKKNRVDSKILEIIKPSDVRIDPKCDYFGECGGCSWQNMPYNEQMKWKEQHVKDAFVRQEKLDYGDFFSILEAPDQFNYRNKMEFSFGASRWLTQKEIETGDEIDQKNFALGLHAKGRFDKVIDIKECHIHAQEANQVLNLVRKLALKYDLDAHNLRTHEGFLRNLIIRRSIFENELLIVLITTSQIENEFIKEVSDELSLLIKGSFLHAINDQKNPVNIDSSEVKFGKGYLKEKVLDVIFKISPFSFFQTNSFQLNPFIQEILNFAEINKDQVVWDLYCGTGSISLPAARIAKEVYGVELFESSVIDAKENAKLNNIHNASFHTADLHDKKTPELLNEFPKPDVLILDPPRAGIHKNLLSHILELEIPRVIYVSCNPATQARDCGILDEKYEIKKIRPVDMFPQTYHIESIAELKLK